MLVPPGTWHWRESKLPFHGSLSRRAQSHKFLQYTQKRDMKRIYANEPTRWTRYNPSLMAKLTKMKRLSPRQRGCRIKHLFDWMAHSRNLAKGSPTHRRDEAAACPFCGEQETQQHINVACTHPPLLELRRAHRRHVDEFFQTYRHHNLPEGQRWIVPVIEYMEDQLWTNTEQGGDVWNGRWSASVIERLIPVSQTHKVQLTDCQMDAAADAHPSEGATGTV